MINIIYNGDISPCRIKVGSAIFDNWAKGEIKTISDDIADKLLENKNFSVSGAQKNKKEDIKEESKKDIKYHDLDLNRDGKVDKKDASIAGKTLAYTRNNI